MSKITQRLGAGVERHRGRSTWLSLPEAGLVAALFAYVGSLTVFLIFTLVTTTMAADLSQFDRLGNALTAVNGLFAVLIVIRLVALARSPRVAKRANAFVLLAALVLVALVQVLTFSITDAIIRWSTL